MIRFAMYSRLDQRVFIRSNRITIGGGRVPGVLCAEVTLNEVIARGFTSSKIWKSVPALPGERILILISPGFLTPFEDAMALASQVLGMAARDNVIINAIDSRGLYTTNLESSERGGGFPLASSVQNQNRPVSMTADEGVMADLADGSGGTYLHGHNDFEAGLTRLFSVPKYLYLLTFSVAKPNGAYHELKVRVNHAGLTV